MMSRKIKQTARACSVADALDVVGDRWSLLVLRELGMGVRRFGGIQANTGAPRDILTARLRKLEAAGVIERKAYSERPPRSEYALADSGRALAPVLMALQEWGDTFLNAGREPRLLQHDCGERFHAAVACAACGALVAEDALVEVPG